MPASMTSAVYSPAIGNMSLPQTRVLTSARAQNRVDRLLDVVRLAFLDDQHRVLADAERHQFVVDQRIGDVHDVERHTRRAPDVGEPEPLQRADDAVVHAALQDDADLGDVAVEHLVELALA